MECTTSKPPGGADQPVIPAPGQEGPGKDREPERSPEPGQRIRGTARTPHEAAGAPAGQKGDIDIVAILGTLGHSDQQPAGVRADPAGNGPAQLLHRHQHPGHVSHRPAPAASR